MRESLIVLNGFGGDNFSSNQASHSTPYLPRLQLIDVKLISIQIKDQHMLFLKLHVRFSKLDKL